LAREEIVKVARGGKGTPRPWETKTRDMQTAVREAYRRQAEELQRSSSATDRELATQVLRFVAGMPEVETSRGQLLKDLARAISKAHPTQRGKDKERGGEGSER
jgi:hypothetical protein